ncbi:MAG: HD domain-containing phosphohydrolase [Planctomycetota bacterium]|jgi:putative two-component system response regulator
MDGWNDLQRSAVLVVDDNDGVRRAISRFLEQDGYPVASCANLAEAREALATRDILVVITDLTMPAGDSGLDLLDEVREQHKDLDVLIMTGNSDLTSAVEALKRGAYDYLRKPFPFEALRAAVQRAVERRHLIQKETMLAMLEERRLADQDNLKQFLVSMATMIDAKCRYTARHSARVSDLSRLLAEALGFDADRTEMIALGGRLHDIGKIGTPDHILNKNGPLTRDEYAVMRLHPSQGDDLIAPIRSMQEIRPIIRWHHESLDGQGYPDGLPGDEVPEDAFVVKVADYWEAITSQRPYRDPMPLDMAVKTLRAEAGVRIPAPIVETFLTAIQDAPIALPALAVG